MDVIMDSALGDRVNLNIKTQPSALLTFMGVQEEDMGTYRWEASYILKVVSIIINE